MATKTLNRRQWIKNSTLATGSFALLSGSLADALAKPASLSKYVSTHRNNVCGNDTASGYGSRPQSPLVG